MDSLITEPPPSQIKSAARGSILISASNDSLAYAVMELRATFGQDTRVTKLAPDLAAVEIPAALLGSLRDECDSGRIALVRHLTVLQGILNHADAASEAGWQQVAEWVRQHDSHPTSVALQAWTSGVEASFNAGDLARHVTPALVAAGIQVRRSGEHIVLSLCIAPGGVVVGINSRENSLSDWPGGRVRLATRREQISRAEFKLEELFSVFDIQLPTGKAVDLGASPGGWTRILRQQGLQVWAVDPGNLDPRVARDRGVYHVKKTAGEFFRHSYESFDIVVNDMKMDPVLSAETMLGAATHLKPGGLAIMILKLGSGNPLDPIKRSMQMLAKSYRILHARQLHHNRHEVTVIARRLDDSTSR